VGVSRTGVAKAELGINNENVSSFLISHPETVVLWYRGVNYSASTEDAADKPPNSPSHDESTSVYVIVSICTVVGLLLLVIIGVTAKRRRIHINPTPITPTGVPMLHIAIEQVIPPFNRPS
jgi:hypothetical protein